MTAPWRGALGARSFACRSRSVALARAAASSVSSRGRFGAGPSENLLCRLGLPSALAAGDLASREKPLFLPRGGPRGGGEKPLFLCIFVLVSKARCVAQWLRPTTTQARWFLTFLCWEQQWRAAGPGLRRKLDFATSSRLHV